MTRKPLVSKIEVSNYTCPYCKKDNTNKSEIEKCIGKHEYKHAKDKQKWIGNSGLFKKEEELKSFVEFRKREWLLNCDFDDEYKFEIIWEGPGDYIERCNTHKNEYMGTTTYSIWYSRIRRYP